MAALVIWDVFRVWLNHEFWKSALLFFVSTLLPCLFVIFTNAFWPELYDVYASPFAKPAVSRKKSVASTIWKTIHSVFGIVVCVFFLAVFYGLNKRFPNDSNASTFSTGTATGFALISAILGIHFSRQVVLDKFDRLVKSIEQTYTTGDTQQIPTSVSADKRIKELIELNFPKAP